MTVLDRAAKLNATSAPPDHAAVRFPPPIIYVAGFLAGVGLERAVPLPGLPEPWAIALGILGIALGAGFVASAIALFRRAGTSMVPVKPTSALVTSGLYRITRNPMYVGLAFVTAGLAIWFGVIWTLVLLPLVILAVDRAVIAREERYLERVFDDEYRRYKTRVRRWL